MEISEVSNNNWLSIFEIIHFDEENIKNPISEQEKKEKWVPDEKVNNCLNCNKEFSTLLRKHHCRICGNIFCNDCANQNICIKLKNNNITIKVCDKCSETYKKFSSIVEENLTMLKGSKTDIEMKISLFCKTFDFYQDEVKKFSEMNMEEEKKFKIQLNESFDILLKILVFNVLNKNIGFNKSQEWTNIIYLLVKESIIYLRPSSRYLNDSIDINDYIKIKIIESENKNKSHVIQGYAFKKNVINKKMKIDIDNPTILLVDPIDSVNIFNDINDSIISVLNAYIEIIKQKIKNLNPDVILFSDNFPKSFIDYFLSDNDRTVIFNIKQKTLLDLERCTQTILIPSLNLIGKKTLLGKCKKFQILKFKKPIKQNKENISLKNNEYNLMIFEGCDRRLFSTILLFGDNIEELKILKNLLKKIILPTARDLYLQKFMIYFFNHQLPETNLLPVLNLIEPKKSSGLIFIDKMFNIKDENEIKNENLNEISTSVNKNIFTKKESNTIYIQGFDVSLIDKDSYTNNLEIIKLIMSKDSSKNLINNDTIQNNKEIIKEVEEGIKLEKNDSGRESDIQKNVALICERSKSVTLQYYNNQYDKTLGQYILDLCQQSTKQCENCHKTFDQHVYYLYRNKRRIKISMILEEKESDIDKILNFIDVSENGNFLVQKFDEDVYNLINSEIFTYGYCKKCNNIVTPLNRLPNEIFNYSLAKFFKDIFKNHSTVNFCERKQYNIKKFFENNNCHHNIYSDIIRIFVTKFGSWQFEYESIPSYFIIPNNLNSLIINSFSESNLLEKYISQAYETSTRLITLFNNYLNIKLTHANKLKEIKEMDNFSSVLDSIIQIINKIIQKLEFFSVNIINKYLSNQFKYDSYVKAIIYIKKVYLNIVRMKVISNKFDSLIDDLEIIIHIIIGEIPPIYDEFYLRRKNKLSEEELSNIDNNGMLSDINLNTNQLYKEILNWLNFYDNKHNLYSCEVNEMDLSSLIAYALTSDDYYTFLQNGKLKLNEIKCERNAKEYIKDIIYKNIEKRMSKKVSASNLLSSLKSEQKNQKEKLSEEEEIYDTLLLFNQSKQKFFETDNPKSTNSKILHLLETELINEQKEKFHFFAKNQIDYYLFPDENQKKNILNLNSKNLRLSLQKKLKNIKSQEENNSIKLNSNNFIIFDDFTSELKKLNEKIENTISEFNEIKNNYINNLKLDNEKNKENQKIIPEFDKICKANRKEYIEEKIEIGSDSTEYELVAYFPRQFEAFRIAYCATFSEFIISMSKSYEWSNVSGGKSKATFSKSIDQKYILKFIAKSEFKMFIDNCTQLFHYFTKYLFHNMPSALTKILGAYKIKIKRAKETKIEKYYILLMENLYYGMKNYSNNTNNKGKIKVYDLKGSKLNRYIPRNQQISGKVLLDTNYLEDYNGEPIAVDKNVYKIFRTALLNDTLILSKMNIIDYSLLLILDETEKEKDGLNLIKLGIIDYTRKYTWDKQLESYGKILMNGISVKPTIINPEAYRNRFIKEIEKYLIGV